MTKKDIREKLKGIAEYSGDFFGCDSYIIKEPYSTIMASAEEGGLTVSYQADDADSLREKLIKALGEPDMEWPSPLGTKVCYMLFKSDGA